MAWLDDSGGRENSKEEKFDKSFEAPDRNTRELSDQKNSGA